MNEMILGYIVQVNPFKDEDAMVKILSDKGFFSFYVRKVFSIKSTTLAATQLGSLTRFHFKENKKGVMTLQQLSLVWSPMIEFSSPQHFFTLEALIELTNKTIEGDDGGTIYPFFAQALATLKDQPLRTLFTFMQAIISINGIDLVHRHCVICGQKKAIVGITYQEGGVICAKCSEKHPFTSLQKDALLAIVYPHKDEFIQALNDHQLLATIKVYSQHLTHQLNMKLITIDNLVQMLS